MSFLADPLWMGKFLTTVLGVASTGLGASSPPRVYVSAGAPVSECGQLTVHLENLRPTSRPTSTQTDPGGTKEIVTVADVIVTYMRCVRTLTHQGEFESAAHLNTDGLAFSNDAQALWFALIGATLDGTLFPTLVHPPVLWRGMSQIANQSMLVGWKATMEVTLA